MGKLVRGAIVEIGGCSGKNGGKVEKGPLVGFRDVERADFMIRYVDNLEEVVAGFPNTMSGFGDVGGGI